MFVMMKKEEEESSYKVSEAALYQDCRFNVAKLR